jgi:uncharacterized membrane protein YbaN (DUF454 family)
MSMQRLESRERAGQRRVLAGLGIACVALGTLGIFVPGLPTTVFLLAASYFFARSSRRLHDWLTGHPRLGAYLRMAHGGMPRRARVVSLIAMWLGIGGSVVMMTRAGMPLLLVAVVVALGVVGSIAILSTRLQARFVRASGAWESGARARRLPALKPGRLPASAGSLSLSIRIPPGDVAPTPRWCRSRAATTP